MKKFEKILSSIFSYIVGWILISIGGVLLIFDLPGKETFTILGVVLLFLKSVETMEKVDKLLKKLEETK